MPTPAPAAAPATLPAKPTSPPAATLWPELNLGFEQVTGERPTGWTSTMGYQWTASGERRHGGEHSLRLQSAGSRPFGSVIASVPADAVRGRHLVLHGWVKTEGVKGSAAMFLRVDGGGDASAFDDMADRGLTGSGRQPRRAPPAPGAWRRAR